MAAIKIIVVALAVFFTAAFQTDAADTVMTVSGRVCERNGEAIPGVMVIVKDREGRNVAYTMTNRAGEYSVACYTALYGGTINFSCLGFAKVSKPIAGIKDRLDITLEEEAYKLKEVTVRVPPIKANGDTITYDVNSFKTASDRTIEDILKKLPGIQVADNGKIQYNGEDINKFYIEGLDMLSGRYALATRNISPDDVTQVNVYENHQPKRVLKDIEYSDKAAINLKLKKKSLLRPLGYVKGGAGMNDDSDGLWLGELHGMLIAPKMQALITAKGNNAGVSYSNETRSFISEGLSENTNAYGVYPATPFGSANIPTERYYDNRSVSASVNTLSKLSEFTTLNITADYADNINCYDNSSSVIYSTDFSDGVTICENVSNRLHLREAKFNVKIENNANRKYISNKLGFIGHFNDNGYAIDAGRSIGQDVATRDVNICNRFKGIFRFGKSVIDFTSDTQFSTTPTNRLTAASPDSTLIAQNISGVRFVTKENAAYTWIINACSSLGVKAEFNLDYGTFKSEAQFPGDYIPCDIRGYDITTTVEPSYQYRPSSDFILNLSVPVRVHNLDFDNRADVVSFPTNRIDADLRARINYNTPFQLKTLWTFGRLTSLGGLSDYIVNPVYVTFRQSSAMGSGQLGERTTYYASADFSYRNTLDGLFSSATVMYRRTTSNRLSSLDIDNGEINTSSREIDNRTQSVSATVTGSKKVYEWSTVFAIEGHCEMLKKDIYRNSHILNLNVDSYMCRANINSSPLRDYLMAILDVRYSYSRQSTGITKGHSRNFTASMTMSTHPVKKLELRASGYFSRTSIPGDAYKNSLFIDCSAICRLGKLEVELAAKNLANNKRYTYSYISDSDTYAYTFDLRPLQVLLMLKCTF